MSKIHKIVRDMIGRNSSSDEYDKKYPTKKFKDFTRGQKDEVHKAMKNPNWESGFLTKDKIGKNNSKPVSFRQAWQAAHQGSWKCHGYTLEPDATCPKCGRGVL